MDNEIKYAIELLASKDTSKSSTGFRVFREKELSSIESIEAMEYLLNLLGSKPSLEQLEQFRRLFRILNNSIELHSLLNSARVWPKEYKNAIASILRGTDRRKLSISTILPPTLPKEITERTQVVASIIRSNQQKNHFVLILSSVPQEDLVVRLKEVAFDAVIQSSLKSAKLELEQTDGEICAVLVDGSFLTLLNEDEQHELFSLLALYSSSIWIRVDESGLRLKHSEVTEIIGKERCEGRVIQTREISFQQDGILRNTEIEYLESAAKIHEEAASTEVIPIDLSIQEMKALRIAAALYAREKHLPGSLTIKSVETLVLHGGQSQAKVVLLRINLGGRFLVAKIGSQKIIRNELNRYIQFIRAGDSTLHMHGYLHAGKAVIFLELVTASLAPDLPAPKLEEELHNLWFNESIGSMSESLILAEEKRLCAGLSRVISDLEKLCSSPCPATNYTPQGNPNLKYIEEQEKRGMGFECSEPLKKARSDAHDTFLILESSSVVHGDMHLKNVVARGEDMFLIDYSGTGPGHPALDFVRLDVALFTGIFKHFSSYENAVELQHDLTFTSLTLEELLKKYPQLAKSSVNRVCLHGCLLARNIGIKVLKKHNSLDGKYVGGPADWVAAKLLVAWQNLSMEGRDQFLSRAIIDAIPPSSPSSPL